MTTAVSWIVELVVERQNLTAFRDVTEKMISAASNEPGTLRYERLIDDSTGKVLIFECYRSSEDAVQHMQHFTQKFSAEYAPLIRRERFIVMGELSVELRAVLAPFSPTCYRPLAGFRRDS